MDDGKRIYKKSIAAPVIIAVLGAVMVLYGLFNLFLSFAGTDTTAAVASSTYVHKKGNPPNTYTYSVSYTFEVNGKKYSGSSYITKKMYGNPAGAINVKYFPSSPGLNTPARYIGKNVLAMTAAGVALILLNVVIIRQETRKRKPK